MRAEHARALAEAIVETLEVALDNGGSSIDDYRDARGERGSMQDEFQVHTREGQECPRCGTEIRRIVVGGRSTYFCPGCQTRLRRRRRSRAAARAVSEALPPPAGFEIGHRTDAEGVTGCTVILAPEGARGGRGRARAAGPGRARPT